MLFDHKLSYKFSSDVRGDQNVFVGFFLMSPFQLSIFYNSIFELIFNSVVFGKLLLLFLSLDQQVF